ncbi:hypothetical protein Tco_0051819 [Tanacetum coccineum]
MPWKYLHGLSQMSNMKLQWHGMECRVEHPCQDVGFNVAAFRMFPEESDKIKKYVGGLLDMIHRSVVASKPKTMQDAVEIATELMDKKIRTFDECPKRVQRKFEDPQETPRQTQQQ